MKKDVVMYGEWLTARCDEKCWKAWGTERPRDANDQYMEDEDLIGVDAPEDPGTYEGGEGKPTCDEEKGNKWCLRECERCEFVDIILTTDN